MCLNQNHGSEGLDGFEQMLLLGLLLEFSNSASSVFSKLKNPFLVEFSALKSLRSLLLWIILLFPNATFFPLEIFSMCFA